MRRRGRVQLISRFALVGLSATALYAVLALLLGAAMRDDTGQAVASLLAYVATAIFSYCAHRVFTFASNGDYRFEIPRFAALTLSGVATSFIVPLVLAQWLLLPMVVPVAVVCVVIPLLNYVALDHWVFGDGIESG